MTNVAAPKCVICTQGISEEYAVDVGLIALVESASNSIGGVGDCVAEPSAKKRGVAVEAARCARHIDERLLQVCCDCMVRVCVKCAEDVHGGHDVVAEADSVSVLRQRLAASQAMLGNGASQLLSSIPLLQPARQRMVERCEASLVRLEADAVVIKAAIDAHIAITKADLNRELKARLKAIDSQLDAMAVSASQLQAGVELCSSMLSKPVSSPSAVIAASSTITHLKQLIAPYRGPCVSTVCEVQCDVDVMLEAVGVKSTQLRLQLAGDDVAVTQSSGRLVYGGENVVDVRVPDWVSADDVIAWIAEVTPVSAPVSDLTVVGAGNFAQIRFSCQDCVEEVVIGVCVAGCPLRSSQFRLRQVWTVGSDGV